jgi:hypothetical protein
MLIPDLTIAKHGLAEMLTIKIKNFKALELFNNLSAAGL